jgi:hypothetical protein
MAQQVTAGELRGTQGPGSNGGRAKGGPGEVTAGELRGTQGPGGNGERAKKDPGPRR